MKIIIRIEGMSCSHCEKRVEDTLEELGVDVNRVSAIDGQAEVIIDGDTMIEKIKESVDDIGYHVIEVI